MASDNFSSILQNFNDLNKEWHSKRPNLTKCGQLLTKLKVTILAVHIFWYTSDCMLVWLLKIGADAE